MHPGDQLPRAERLGEVVVGADGEADDEVGLGVAGGEHQHRHRSVALDLAAHLEAVEAREHEVEHHEVGLEAPVQARRPAGPSAAISTAKPSLRSRVATASAIDASSSTTRIVRVEGRGRCGHARSKVRSPSCGSPAGAVEIRCRSAGESDSGAGPGADRDRVADLGRRDRGRHGDAQRGGSAVVGDEHGHEVVVAAEGAPRDAARESAAIGASAVALEQQVVGLQRPEPRRRRRS